MSDKIEGAKPVSEFEKRMEARAARKALIKTKAEEYEQVVMLALDDAEIEYGDTRVKRVDIAPGECSVIVAYTPALSGPMKHFRSSSANGKGDKERAMANICKAAVVWPAKGQPMDIDGVEADYPLCRTQIVNTAVALAGFADQEDAGK